MKFCANLSFMFTEASSILERYALAKDAGFKAVESGFPFGCSLDQVLKAKNEAGLDQVLINICTGDLSKGELGVAAVPGKEDEFKKNLNLTIDYAKALGTAKIHIMSGKLDVAPTEIHWNTFESNLKYATERLRAEHILGLIEPINPHSVPKYLNNNFDKALEIVKRINSPNLKLQLDIFHLQHIAGDLTYNIERLLPYVGHVQIAQVPNRNEPDTLGEINYEYIFKVLEKNNYNDWIGLEYKPASGSKEGLKWLNKYGYQL